MRWWCLATLGITVPSCHLTLNGFLPPCSFVSAVVWIAHRLWCLRSLPSLAWVAHRLQFFRGVPAQARFTHRSWYLMHVLAEAWVTCGLQSSLLSQPQHRWCTATVPQGCPCSSMCHPLWPAHDGSWPSPTQGTTVTPSYLHLVTSGHYKQVLQTGRLSEWHGVGWPLDWNQRNEHWDGIRIRKVRLKTGTESVRKPE